MSKPSSTPALLEENPAVEFIIADSEEVPFPEVADFDTTGIEPAGTPAVIEEDQVPPPIIAEVVTEFEASLNTPSKMPAIGSVPAVGPAPAGAGISLPIRGPWGTNGRAIHRRRGNACGTRCRRRPPASAGTFSTEFGSFPADCAVEYAALHPRLVFEDVCREGFRWTSGHIRRRTNRSIRPLRSPMHHPSSVVFTRLGLLAAFATTLAATPLPPPNVLQPVSGGKMNFACSTGRFWKSVMTYPTVQIRNLIQLRPASKALICLASPACGFLANAVCNSVRAPSLSPLLVSAAPR